MLLYKYRDISGDGFINTQDIFVNQRLYLPELKSLNDPNESIAEIQINNPLKEYGNMLEERNRKNVTRIFSLSETQRSSLMWAHYAASHTGICIAFDFSDWVNTDSIMRRQILPPCRTPYKIWERHRAGSGSLPESIRGQTPWPRPRRLRR